MAQEVYWQFCSLLIYTIICQQGNIHYILYLQRLFPIFEYFEQQRIKSKIDFTTLVGQTLHPLCSPEIMLSYFNF